MVGILSRQPMYITEDDIIGAAVVVAVVVAVDIATSFGSTGVGVDVRIFFIDLGYKYGLNDYISKNGKSAPLNSFLVNLGVRF